MENIALNIGSGKIRPKIDGVLWVNMDIDERVRPDVCRDVLRGIPFNDNYFDAVLCSHFLEHFGGDDFIFVMSELHRVLKPWGELHILSPYYKHFSAWTDPFHKMFFNEYTFEHYWFITNSSLSMGVKGWFKPEVLEVSNDSELRLIMKKIPFAELKSYMDSIQVFRDNEFFAPDFFSMLSGTKYYEWGKNGS